MSWERDLAYLQAEMAQAMNMGITTTVVRVTELQSIITRMKELAKLPAQPVRVFGYARTGEVAQMVKGKTMTIRVRRKPNEFYSEPVYNDPKFTYSNGEATPCKD